MANRVYIDCETDGVRYDRQVWDVGIVQYSSNGGRQEHSWLVKDVDLSGADGLGLEIGHFRRRHPLAGGTPPPGTELRSEKDIAHDVFKLLYGATVAGIVVNFDTHALDQMLRRHKLYPPSWHHLLCVESQALGALHVYAQINPEVAEAHGDLLARAEEIPGRWRTDEVAAAFGIPETPEHERHTAIGDARLAERIYHASIVDNVVPLPGAHWSIPTKMLTLAA